jgi:O-antigen chain-terminating methyltransferase
VESAELIAILREVRERVRARYPEGTAGDARIPLPDLEPLVRARDAALGKVAAIGAVNPRRGGPLNWLVQGWKRFVARLLDWHVREQVVFNRRAVDAVDAIIETLVESNRALATAGGAIAELTRELEAAKTEFRDGLQARDGVLFQLHDHMAAVERLAAEGRENFDRLSLQMKDIAAHWSEWRLGWDHKLAQREADGEKLIAEFGDIRKHWSEWRVGWEHKLATNEIQFLRSVADLQAAFGHRADLMDANYRDTVRAQHADFTAALAQANLEIQNRLLADMERVKLEYERLIHAELRLIRQRLQPAAGDGAPPLLAAPAAVPPILDYAWFAERFRGPQALIKASQRSYVPYFAGKREVLDIGCGRGEFLELMREAGISAAGIDSSSECVAACREKGLAAQAGDLFEYLGSLPEESLDGIFCAQVVEHLPPGRLPEMIRLCAARLERGGVLVIETPNPACLAIFATYFYLDPTHVRPVPLPLLEFYFGENGLGVLAAPRSSPAIETMPALASLPKDFQEQFFGALDYAIVGTKL